MNLPTYPHAIDWAAPLPAHPAHEIMEATAARFPARIAVDFLGARLTYGRLLEQVNHAARGLQLLGVKKGDRVGLLLPNCPHFVVFYYAILKAGGTVVNLNPLYAPGELANLVGDSGLVMAVTADLKLTCDKILPLLGQGAFQRLIVCPMADMLPKLKGFAYRLLKKDDIAAVPKGEMRVVPVAAVLANNGQAEPVAIDPHVDVAVLQYTGGTTGVPKGAMLSHANITANTMQSRLWFAGAKEGEEVLLGVLPFFHVFAMTVAMNLSVLIGATMLLLPRFDLKQTVQTIHRKRPTLIPAVPTIFAAIANFKGLRAYDISCVNYCISGGAGLPLEVKQAFEAVTGCVVVEGYGLTESSPVATCNPLEGLNKAGSIGLPLPGTHIDIVSLEDGQTLLPPGEKGEVCIRGPQVMLGYWHHAQETAGVLKPTADGVRLHTGDVGVRDADGYIAIVDRIKDMILCSGYNVYPRNVEAAIYQHDAVAECIVAGLPDPYRGQTVKAYIVLKPGQSLKREELIAFLRSRLSPMEMPKQVEFRDSLPRTMIGKLSRKALLEEEAAEAASGTT